MKNFGVGMAIIFVGAFGGYISRYFFTEMITGTSTGELILSKGSPVILFFCILIFGLLVMFGKKPRQSR
jgi:hypothetical protein